MNDQELPFPDRPAILRFDPDWGLVFLAWLVASVSTLGSLFFSFVLEFAACDLCWYQRICLFPLVVLLARALFPLDLHVVRYALPLTAAGWLLAAYHNLLFIGIIPASMQPCVKGVSCTEDYLELFGFLSIPLLSLLSFTALMCILVALKRKSLA